MPMTSGFPRHRMDDHQTKHMNIRLGKKIPRCSLLVLECIPTKKHSLGYLFGIDDGKCTYSSTIWISISVTCCISIDGWKVAA